MKKVLCILITGILMVLSFGGAVIAQTRDEAEDTYYVRVETNPSEKDGAHIDRVTVPHGETCTLTIDSAAEGFVFWNLHGEYEIVEGDYQEDSFTIRPLSDLVAVATYEEAMPHTAIESAEENPPAVQTGEDETRAVAVLIMMIAIVVAATCAVFLR